MVGNCTYKHIMKNVLKIHCLVRIQIIMHLSLYLLQNSVTKYEQNLYWWWFLTNRTENARKYWKIKVQKLMLMEMMGSVNLIKACYQSPVLRNRYLGTCVYSWGTDDPCVCVGTCFFSHCMLFFMPACVCECNSPAMEPQTEEQLIQRIFKSIPGQQGPRRLEVMHRWPRV